MIALIPLRGGSKSIPLKNIKEMAGKPLCAWVIQAAKHSMLFRQIIVSTDHEGIAEIADMWGARVIMRPAELATDTATTESVMLHIAQKVDFDVLCTIQATSPLTDIKDLINGFCEFENYDSLFSGHRVKKFFWTDDLKPINYNPLHRPMRQEWEGTIVENGAFYFTKRSVLEKHKCRLGGKIGAYIMPNSVDIDTMQDWELAEKYLRSGRRGLYMQ